MIDVANFFLLFVIAIGVVYIALLVCSVGMGLLLMGSLYRLLSGQMTEQEMCPDFDDVL